MCLFAACEHSSMPYIIHLEHSGQHDGHALTPQTEGTLTHTARSTSPPEKKATQTPLHSRCTFHHRCPSQVRACPFCCWVIETTQMLSSNSRLENYCLLFHGKHLVPHVCRATEVILTTQPLKRDVTHCCEKMHVGKKKHS